MGKYIFIFILILILFALAGCSGNSTPPTATPLPIYLSPLALTPDPTDIPVMVTQTATGTPTITHTIPPVTPRPTRTLAPKPTNTNTVTATFPPTSPPLVPPPAGLVYQTDDAIWRIDDNEAIVQITGAGQWDWFWFFADYKRMMLVLVERPLPGFTPDDYAIVNLFDSAKTPLVPPDGYHLCEVEETGKPDWMSVVLMPDTGITSGSTCQGIPALMNLNGKIKPLRDTEEINPTLGLGKPALSPDGEFIAFDQAGEPWIYTWDAGSEVIDLAKYSFPVATGIVFMNPAWSPRGNHLAWVAAMKDVHGLRMPDNIAILNLKEQISHLVHAPSPGDPLVVDGAYVTWSPDERIVSLYNTYQGGTWADIWCFTVDGLEIACPETTIQDWSPNGAWYVHAVYEAPESTFRPVQTGIVVTSADGSETHEFAIPGNVVWSPDSRRLALSSRNDDLYSHWMIEVDIWQVYQLDVPADARIEGWIP